MTFSMSAYTRVNLKSLKVTYKHNIEQLTRPSILQDVFGVQGFIKFLSVWNQIFLNALQSNKFILHSF